MSVNLIWKYYGWKHKLSEINTYFQKARGSATFVDINFQATIQKILEYFGYRISVELRFTCCLDQV